MFELTLTIGISCLQHYLENDLVKFFVKKKLPLQILSSITLIFNTLIFKNFSSKGFLNVKILKWNIL